MRARLHTLVTGLLLALLLSGCQPVARDAGDAQLAPLRTDPAAVVYTVDPRGSQLLVYAYRDGRLAAMGHNHVISSDSLEGEIYLAPAATNTAFEIRLPVTSLKVDIPELRAQAGDEFPGELTQDARDGTRANMLGERQLDAAVWPELVMRSRGVSGVLPDLTVIVDIAVRGYVRQLEVPVKVTSGQGRVAAEGRFSVNQTDLGLEPFSVMMGALTVRDRLDIQFSIDAVAAD